jgi:tRNA (guanine37-N1)-methyltransferase
LPRLIRAALAKAGVDDGGRASTGVDVVGDIAIVRLGGFTPREKKKSAEALLSELKNVRVVMEQEGGIEGEYRLRKLKRLAGEKRSLTLHRENGCAFRVDVAKCYFSPRLSTERLRVAEQVSRKELVLNMFAGVGPFSILIAKKTGASVESCELNPYAAELHRENDRLNKVEQLVSVVNADALDLPKLTSLKFDRVLMPHPSGADRFLPTALRMAKKGGHIYYYRHVLGKDEAEGAGRIREELSSILPPRTRYTLRRIREVGPRWLEMLAEIHVAS